MSFHWWELAQLTLCCTQGLGRTWPDMALLLPFHFLSIHVYPPISRGQRQQQATRPGEELGERGHKDLLLQTVTPGGELSAALGVPLLESQGKAGRKERPQEINKRAGESHAVHWNVDFIQRI